MNTPQGCPATGQGKPVITASLTCTQALRNLNLGLELAFVHKFLYTLCVQIVNLFTNHRGIGGPIWE
jgi:hypothetical protein